MYMQQKKAGSVRNTQAFDGPGSLHETKLDGDVQQHSKKHDTLQRDCPDRLGQHVHAYVLQCAHVLQFAQVLQCAQMSQFAQLSHCAKHAPARALVQLVHFHGLNFAAHDSAAGRGELHEILNAREGC